MKKVFAAIFMILCFMFYVSPVLAQYGYEGPTTSLSILITKMVGVPSTNKGGQAICDSSVTFQDNFSPSNPRFKPNDFICFKLTVKNTSNTTLTNVTVKDFLPSFINPVSGPGSFDSNSRIITFSAGDFNSDEEKVFFMLSQVQGQNLLPSDQGLFCINNKAQAFNDNVSNYSSSQFCIEKQVQGVTTTPSAGPEMGALLISGEFFTLAAGLFIRKRLS